MIGLGAKPLTKEERIKNLENSVEECAAKVKKNLAKHDQAILEGDFEKATEYSHLAADQQNLWVRCLTSLRKLKKS